ncbi:ESF1 homolog [Condylostylus longicornis]|uniref:ESF1 homolog n=1 Tax=Condylostylus longicornis TaxID=2530218 RepID=UPI00244DED4C|nr:ESF1 homolog [Condylostylus longicornis]
MSNIWEDSRFSNLLRDSRFKNLPTYKKQIKIDKRFKSMFDEAKFNSKQGVDKYGRPLLNSNEDELKKYYDIDSDGNSEEEIEKEAILEEKALKSENDNYMGDELSNDGIILSTEIKKKLLNDVDFARGEGKIISDSSSDDETSEEENDEVEHEFWGELDNNFEETQESTKRLAFCNMDWDQIKAVDIMILCHSFLPVGGAVLSVKVYVSEFGKNCLKEEETKGPLDLVGINQNKQAKLELSENDDSEDEGDSYHMEKLRQYQINKLKYYYAIAECDSKETAEKLYVECDGLEYESTSTKLDLRFIPDDMSFNDEDIRDHCTDLPMNISNYKPHLQPVTALQQAKVKVTWDDTTLERKEVFEKLSSGKYEEITAEELKKYVNCSEDENSDVADDDCITNTEGSNTKAEFESNMDAISKYKLLLEDIKNKEKQNSRKKFEMEYSWGINQSTNERTNRDNTSKRNSDDGGYSSDDIPSDIDLNDPYFAEELGTNSRKGKKKKQKLKKDFEEFEDSQTNELKLLLGDFNDDSGKKDRKSKRKTKRKNEGEDTEKGEKMCEPGLTSDNFQVNVKDKRFESIYTSTSYSIDPNNPRFKKTLGMDSIIQEKIRRRDNTDKQKS